jgi:hypothetical protein
MHTSDHGAGEEVVAVDCCGGVQLREACTLDLQRSRPARQVRQRR